MDLGDRLARYLRSLTQEPRDFVEDLLNHGREYFDERLDEWEKSFEHDERFERYYQQSAKSKNQSSSSGHKDQEQAHRHSSNQGHQGHSSRNDHEQQFLDDLKIFDLVPPVTFQQIKKARNREIKKYHPDKFQGDPEKRETAKQILQIYNLAFERLSKHPSVKDT